MGHYNEDRSQVSYLLDDIEDGEEDVSSAENSMDEDDDDDDIEGYSIENAYLDEKEDACSSIGEIAINVGPGFVRYYEISTTEVGKLCQFSAPGVRKAAAMATGQLQCMMGKVVLSGDPGVNKEEFVTKASEVLLRLIEMINDDEDKTVVMATLEAFTDLFKATGQLWATQDALVTSLMEAVKNVFQEKTACQGEEDDYEGAVDDDEQAEQDAMVIEYAGDLVPAVAAGVGGEKFAPYLAGLLQLILAKIKKSSPVADKSFVTGILSETVVAMGAHIQPFNEHLFQAFMRLVGDEEDEICNNSVFGLGLLAQHGGEKMYQHFPAMLQVLSATMSHSRGEHVVDNVCSAVCRMIAANASIVPVDQVLPALLEKLPLKKDLEENDSVYPCLAHLLQTGHTDALLYMARILVLFVQVMKHQTLSAETRQILLNTLKSASSINEEGFNLFVTSLAPDLKEFLGEIMNETG